MTAVAASTPSRLTGPRPFGNLRGHSATAPSVCPTEQPLLKRFR
ncbi:unnamed protein product [Acanthoscelides obtectus]|uniref:Uncharacterized protein n=1 Tax=Acanthoscelides obtectus TaxID=200917 RepID=A0A9P0LCQ6_ACAOB|nr:unnamed protein product [Acanthoscelides obtectus]CAK1645063.1 hypothetical protein AOBTE_LOCUS14009 [Acanthoscelides obtectus]